MLAKLFIVSYLEREDVADLRDGDHGDGAEEGDHAQDGRRYPP